MKPVTKSTSIILLLSFLSFACKKDDDSSDTASVPIAYAGPDRIIVLPVNSIELSGSREDRGRILTIYSWKKLAGPASLEFDNPNTAKTMVKKLVQGAYVFELTISDASGKTGKDQVVITVAATPPTFSATYIGFLSVERAYTSIATAGNKIFIAGGYTTGNAGELIPSSRVDIYSISDGTWSAAELSEPRFGMGGVSLGNKVLFAGGVKTIGAMGVWKDFSRRVDIYNTDTDQWSTTELPEAQLFALFTGIAVSGNKIFFAGLLESSFTNNVLVYDHEINSWTNFALDPPRCCHSMLASGSNIFFAGGYPLADVGKRLDVYNQSTGSWSSFELSKARGSIASASFLILNKHFFAGGDPLSDEIDILDFNTGNWSKASLSKPAVLIAAVSAGPNVYFIGDSQMDIMDPHFNSMSTKVLAQSFSEGSAIISVGNSIYGTVWYAFMANPAMRIPELFLINTY